MSDKNIGNDWSQEQIDRKVGGKYAVHFEDGQDFVQGKGEETCEDSEEITMEKRTVSMWLFGKEGLLGYTL
jgi:hypothetical protein